VTKLMPDLDLLFGSKGESPLAGMFRFMPIEQTNQMIVITPQQEYLRQAEEWLRRLDRGGAENSVQLYVYNVKNLKAPDLADYLSQIFLGTSGGGSRSSTSGRVGQGLRPVTIGGVGGRGGNSMNYGNSLRGQADEKAAPAAAPAASPAAGGGGDKDTNIRISAIEENNQLMVQATPIEWDQIEAAIKKLDVVPLQVQIEAKILEVKLTDQLSYGVQWYLKGLMGTADGSAQENGRYPIEYSGNRWDRQRLSMGARGDVTPTRNGGFFYSFLNSSFEVALQALQLNDQSKTLAAPSLVVANNQEAQINVGEQIPVQQTYVTTGLNAGDQRYGSVQYLNTGITLAVTPRVNPGGLVYLDIAQEVSSPTGAPDASGNRAISQRQLQTQVAVQSGETLLLGGLIQDQQADGQRGIPIISRIPVVGHLFGNSTVDQFRTELIILITPRVITSIDEGRQMTEDYSRQFQSLQPLQPLQPRGSVDVAPGPVRDPTRTYPIEEARPQEDLPNEN
jgi:general secretion pathway protein D